MWIERKTTGPSKSFDLEETAAYAACDSVEIQVENEMPGAGSGMNFIEKWYEIHFDIKDIQFFVANAANTLLGINISLFFFSVWHFWVDNVPVFPQWKKGSELRVQSREEDESLFDSRKMFKYQQRAWLKLCYEWYEWEELLLLKSL